MHLGKATDYLLKPTITDELCASAAMSDETRQGFAEGRAAMRSGVEKLLPLVFGGHGTDDEIEAADSLLLWLGDERRPRLCRTRMGYVSTPSRYGRES